MKYPWSDAQRNKVSNNLEVYEYCSNNHSFPIDGALAKLNGTFGPKTNRNFVELFFVKSGKLRVVTPDDGFDLQENDMYIMAEGIEHTLFGCKCEVFIVCNPPFDINNIDFK